MFILMLQPKHLKLMQWMSMNNTTEKTYILGLSGGPDSIYLLHYMVKNFPEITLIAAHLDHEWRKGSEQDTEFCKQVCKELNVTFVSKKASELNVKIKPNGSQEELGRKLRRHFFEELLKKHNAQAILLGHHADDQMETFFIRLIRGTTIQGLSCMKIQDGLYDRPLLYTTKQEILDYLKEQKITYLEDFTNYSDKYLRNRIRKTVTPAFKAIDTRAEDNFVRSLNHIQQAEFFLEELTQASLDLLLVENKLDVKEFLTLHSYLQKRIVQQWLVKNKVLHTLSENFLNEIIKFLESPRGGSHQLGQDWKLIKKQNQAFFDNN